MPVPTHSPFCQTLVYPTSCWYCQQDIYVLQCSCGSAVLFDDIGPPWPKHGCVGTGGAGGIGGSGLSGWEAVDALRAQGVPISKDIMKRIFPADPLDNSKAHQADTIKRMAPVINQNKNMLAVVRELHLETGRTSAVSGLSVMGMRILGLDPGVHYRQITLVKNDVRPNESYTALVPEHLAQDLKRGAMVMAGISACVRGEFSHWVVSDISPL